jgi:hypothetical protein
VRILHCLVTKFETLRDLIPKLLKPTVSTGVAGVGPALSPVPQRKVDAINDDPSEDAIAEVRAAQRSTAQCGP